MPNPPVWYTIRNIPAEYRDCSRWAQLDDTQLPQNQRTWISARRNAIAAYLGGGSLTGILREFGVPQGEVLRHLNRCLQSLDGREILGWRALVPHRHTKRYMRDAKPSGQTGLAGAFMQFLNCHEVLKEHLDSAIHGEFGDALPESRSAHRALYSKFIRLCRSFGVSSTQYPFSCKDKGRRSLRRYTRSVLQTNFAEGARRYGGIDAAVRAEIGKHSQASPSVETFFDTTSIDEHLLSCVGSVATQRKTQIIPLHRCHFLPLLEHSSRAILGYSVAIGVQPSAQDVVSAIEHALTPWQPRSLCLQGFRYPPGASMPSALPGVAGLCWSTLMVDNATIHFANAVAERIRRTTGAAMTWGAVGRWYTRPLIECLFSALERAGFERLPNSMGRGPGDPLRADAVANAVKYTIDIEELLDLIDVVVCTYNASAQDSIDNLSPLQRIRFALEHSSSSWLPRRLPKPPAHLPVLDEEVITKTIRGNQCKGIRPYIQLEHVRYTNNVLSSSAQLIGRKLRIRVRWRDLRTVRAFFESGEELGVLHARGRWAQTPHDLKLRRAIVSALLDKTLVVSPEADPIQEYLVLKAKQAVQQRARRRGKRERISKEATELARTCRLTQLPIPLVTDESGPARSALEPARGDTHLPSFVPVITHKGRLT